MTTFEQATFVPRPTSLAATPQSHRKPFSTLAELKARLTAAAAGDYIYYAGTGVLRITSANSTPFRFAHFNPSAPVTIDLGTAASIWEPGRVSGNYVELAYTGTGQWDACVVSDSSNLTVYGGSLTTGAWGGGGLRVFGRSDKITWYDGYVHHVGGSGVGIQPIDGGTGASSSIQNLDLRFEVNRPCLNPAWDPHADKGTGSHGCIIHGNSGQFDNSRVVIYAHDPLKPGETSAGKTWPEGAGGSGIEIGTNATGGPTSQNNNVYAIRCENFRMICNGTNPGSTGKQTGGNAINWWGSVPLNNNKVIWAEGRNLSGQVSHGTGGGWYKGNPPILIEHCRAKNTNQAYPLNGLSSVTDPYDRRWNIDYKDIQPAP